MRLSHESDNILETRLVTVTSSCIGCQPPLLRKDKGRPAAAIGLLTHAQHFFGLLVTGRRLLSDPLLAALKKKKKGLSR